MRIGVPGFADSIRSVKRALYPCDQLVIVLCVPNKEVVRCIWQSDGITCRKLLDLIPPQKPRFAVRVPDLGITPSTIEHGDHDRFRSTPVRRGKRA